MVYAAVGVVWYRTNSEKTRKHWMGWGGLVCCFVVLGGYSQRRKWVWGVSGIYVIRAECYDLREFFVYINTRLRQNLHTRISLNIGYPPPPPAGRGPQASC